ncbi:MAG: hypothetical protein COW01_10040 [Bdellovibrionales bacterium CG12_big_fil_rev_8_21_14_0_65_38_15]|nr:MAG: hypothetical protein COW79_06885 [Bdellovibrionales bacterium CG22_combo_CG10-13_8_21_14_all_38_13]PIQ54477.1 MAG: hypothetical protein COW01_10040 [Bdellovibrionales bacterium CG12_big_fil_rev_8_21_14_0_65_38_15]PIR29858.1 MAG: hypothetical protein COV38_07885 [Bdellovibrionales bacterium CG11_big_fil_rev_8_21_14_0_20_38_13]
MIQSNPISQFVFSWILWVLVLNCCMIFIIRPKFIFSPRKRVEMQSEQSLQLKLIFFFILLSSSVLLGCSVYFLKINNSMIKIPTGY